MSAIEFEVRICYKSGNMVLAWFSDPDIMSPRCEIKIFDMTTSSLGRPLYVGLDKRRIYLVDW